ncbi:MAG: helix-turn-helix transcriptional regulator [Prochloraceae cyanobacterium]|nr:helix-turn-helix transcriptional regulator [Prochloraceae cyanobacterium]
MSKNPYIGSSFDEFLEEDDSLSEINTIALKRVLAWQIEQGMKERGLNKTQMASRMKTSRAALNRLMDPENTSVSLNTIERAAKALDKKLQLNLVDRNNED